MTLTSSTGQIETWHLQHFDEEKGWTGPDLEDLYPKGRVLGLVPLDRSHWFWERRTPGWSGCLTRVSAGLAAECSEDPLTRALIIPMIDV
ncbi:hypothetical protein AgCh_004471 [Apium graveolens]